jgi:hypothetical protein
MSFRLDVKEALYIKRKRYKYMNTFQYAQIFQQELDRQVVAKATTGWMEANAGLVIYNGGNTVKVPKITTDGLGNYDRANGFTSGASTLTYETFTMSQDRGRTFMLDRMDVDETNFVATASTIMGEFQRTQVIPEIDAYRYSKIASLAITKDAAVGGYTPIADDILSKLKADITSIQDVIGADVPLVITMSTATLGILENSKELVKQLNVGQFNGNVSNQVKFVEECPIVEVPSARLKTAYIFNDGKTSGQTAGGFTPDASAKTINWIICAQNAPIAVSKTDNMRIFDPNVNQTADAWKLDYRKYHDLWIMDNKFTTIKVNIKEALV